MVALYLASGERKDKIRARARERAILNHPKQLNDPLPVINIEVTNLSLHPVTITSFGWTIGVIRRQHFVQVPDWTDPLTFRLPTRLQYGESANYNFRREEFFENAGEIWRNISKAIPWVGARFIFLVVITWGYPGEFRFRVERSLGRALVNRAQEIKASTISPGHHKRA